MVKESPGGTSRYAIRSCQIDPIERFGAQGAQIDSSRSLNIESNASVNTFSASWGNTHYAATRVPRLAERDLLSSFKQSDRIASTSA